jgi:AAA+ superfamily predicted ATPase
MLPSEPKIFHGRNSELSDILQRLRMKAPRIAILGAGGMGKTSLARAVLHHAEVSAQYTQHRYFVACDSATSKVELAALIGAHLGLKPSKDLTQAVVKFLVTVSPSLLILDNLEMVWEPTELCGDIEEFLSLLTDIKDLALIVSNSASCIQLNSCNTDHNAWSGKASQSTMESPISPSIATFETLCCSTNIH